MLTMSGVLRVRPIFASIAAALSCGLLAGCPNGSYIVLPDDALENAVRTELRKPFGFLTEADMLQLQSLDARNFGVRDLRGLELARNLTSLDVSNDFVLQNSVRNLSPLADLTNLRFLDLQNNDVTDVTPMAGLFNLDELYLAGNPVFNIGPIVANAENGGLGAGDTVSLSREPLIDDEGMTSEIVADQLDRLVDLGVDVILVETSAAQ